MPDDTLNLRITAQDSASATIRKLEQEVKNIAAALKSASDMGIASSQRFYQALTLEAEGIQKTIIAMGGQVKASDAVTEALRRNIIAMEEVRAARTAALETSLGPTIEREINSASAASRTLATSLSAAAEADSRLRDEAIATAAALRAEAEAEIALQTQLLRADTLFAARMKGKQDFASAGRVGPTAEEGQVTRAGNWFMTQGGTKKIIEDTQQIGQKATDAGASVSALDEHYRKLGIEAEIAALKTESAWDRALKGQTFADTATAAGGEAEATAGMSRIGGLFQREARHIVGLFDSLARGQTGQAVSSIAAGARDAGIGIAGLATSMGGLLAVMGTVGILRHAQEMGKWATQAQAMAAATGMTVNELTRLQGSLQLLGLKTTSADAQMRHFAQALSTALADPSSKQADALHRLGVSQEDLEKTGGDASKALMLVADALQHSAEGANKASAESILFGKDLENIVPLLNKGSGGLKDLGDEADKTGLTLNDSTAPAVQRAGEAVDHLGGVITGNAKEAFIAWAPTIEAVAKDLEGLIQTIGELIGAIGQAGSAVSSFLNWVGSSIGALAIGDVELAAAHEKLKHSWMSGYSETVAAVLDPQGAAAEDRLAQAQKDAEAKARARFGITGQHVQMRQVPGAPGVTNLAGMHEAASAAAEEASKDATSQSQMRVLALQAEIGVIKQTINAGQLSAKERAQAETELSNKLMQLHSAELSAGRSGAAAAAKAARQSYEDFAANEKLKVTEADKSVQQIIAIYEDWKDKAANIYHQSAAVITNIAREEAQAINTAKMGELKETERVESEKRKLYLLNQQLLSMAAGTFKYAGQKDEGPKADIGRSQQYVAEAEAVRATAASEVADWQQIAAAADKGSATYKEAMDAINSIILQSKQQEVELYKKAGDAAIAASNKVGEAFTHLFDSLGNHLEEFGTNIANSIIAPQTTIIHAGLTSIKIQENTMKTAFKQLFVGVAQDLGHMLMKSLGDAIAKSISGQAGDTIGKLLSRTLDKAFSSVGDMATKALGNVAGSAAGAAGDAGSKAITTAISASTTQTITNAVSTAATQVAATGTSTTGIVGAISTASSLELAQLSLLNLQQPSIAGTSLAGGGIVSAARGMVSGGVQLSILHDKEMVLPKHISEGLQGAIMNGSFNRGGNSQTANLNYSPSIQMARGRSGTGMSRGELAKLMAVHSGAMMGEARNMMRNGWRP